MSVSIEKLKRDFSALEPAEKVRFLKDVIAVPPGEWIEVNGRIHFIPEGPPATEEEELVFEQAKRDIEQGQGVTLDELKRNPAKVYGVYRETRSARSGIQP